MLIVVTEPFLLHFVSRRTLKILKSPTYVNIEV